MVPGWGVRHEGFVSLLTSVTPGATHETAWANGTVPLRVAGYLGKADLPDELIVSIRCLVRVDDRIVVCTNAEGGRHPWPGGRREPGESHFETARREVLEETGWELDVASLHPVGWLHYEDLTPRDEAWPFPHPDFLQLVLHGQASGRMGGADADWSDTQGYEVSSELLSLDDALAAVRSDPIASYFLTQLT